MNTNAWNRLRYGLNVPFYDVVARRLVRGRRRTIELLDLRPGERVLVPGCGTGLELEHEEPVLFGGLFKVVLLRKPLTDSS